MTTNYWSETRTEIFLQPLLIQIATELLELLEKGIYYMLFFFHLTSLRRSCRFPLQAFTFFGMISKK